jgi:CheY-like chemotaxis protein
MNPAHALDPAGNRPDARGNRILVVDDEPHYRRLIQVNLERQGYEVSAASNGKEALEKIYSEHPDLVIMDEEMPVMGG